MTPAELCERAVERLESTGWMQGSVGPRGGPNCLIGSLLWEDMDMDNRILHCSSRQMAIRSAVGHYIGTENIAAWNDSPNRTEFEVIDAVKTVGKMFANGEITMEPAS